MCDIIIESFGTVSGFPQIYTTHECWFLTNTLHRYKLQAHNVSTLIFSCLHLTHHVGRVIGTESCYLNLTRHSDEISYPQYTEYRYVVSVELLRWFVLPFCHFTSRNKKPSVTDIYYLDEINKLETIVLY